MLLALSIVSRESCTVSELRALILFSLMREIIRSGHSMALLVTVRAKEPGPETLHMNISIEKCPS